MIKKLSAVWQELTQPQTNLELSTADAQALITGMEPVIWLLGKTGAGKTSLVSCLTGLDPETIGNGYEACTKTSVELPYPKEFPLMRFLDTRGLGEPDYDPQQDLDECRQRSHVILVVAKLDDPVQHEIASVLKKIHKQAPHTSFIVVHNGADLITGQQQRQRAQFTNQKLFEDAVGSTLPFVVTSIPEHKIGPTAEGINDLENLLALKLPDVAFRLARQELLDGESLAFTTLRGLVIRYATLAGVADAAPVVGAVAVPSIQAALLRALGSQYGIDWTSDRMRDFSLALGLGALTRFGGSYLARQAAKLVPGFGQTVGAAAASSISFTMTYALGRAAAYYLYKSHKTQSIDRQELRDIYKTALRRSLHRV